MSIIATILIVRWQVNVADARWCDTIRLLVAKAIPPPKNGKPDPEYQLYVDFVNLGRQFGCLPP